MAIKKEYFESMFNEADKTEKTPKIKLPIILTSNIFEIILPKIRGYEVILYLIYAPKIAPIARKRNSIHFNLISF
jgi:hypothetical protein